MKPNFALKLSNDGIELLHRTVGGWSPVGAVAFETDDVAARCAELVKQAAVLEPGGISTKLVLPNSEVRYVSVVAPGPTDEARRYQIEAEIERLTPYRIDELAYDWSVEDDSALVVIAARETLIEAETFAEGYGFNPVSFVALPESGQFLGEPFFGETMVAPTLLPAGAHVQPDVDPVRVLKTRAAPVAAPAVAIPVAPPETTPAPTPKSVEPATPAKPVAPVEAPKPDASKLDASKPDAPKPDASKPDAPKPAPIPPVARPASVPGPARPAAAAWPTSSPLTGSKASVEVEGAGFRVGNLVRRMGTRLRREQVETRKAEAPAMPQPGSPSAAFGPFAPTMGSDARATIVSAVGVSAPVAPEGPTLPAAFAHRPTAGRTDSDTPAGTATIASSKAASGIPALQPVPGDDAAAVAFASRRRNAPVVAASSPAPGKADTPGGRIAVLPGRSEAGADSGAQRFLARARSALAGATASASAAAQVARAKARPTPGAPKLDVKTTAPAATAPVVPSLGQPGGLSARPAPESAPADISVARLGRRNAPPEAIVPASRPPATEREKEREAEALTIFGARGAQRGGSSLAGRGLMAAGGALLLLIAVAVWAVYFNGSGTTQLAGGQVGGISPVAAPASQGPLPGIEAPSTIARAGDGVAAPEALSAPVLDDAGTTDLAANDAAMEAGAPVEVPPESPAEPDALAALMDPEQMLESLVQEARNEALPTETLDAPLEVVIDEAPVAETPTPEAPETVLPNPVLAEPVLAEADTAIPPAEVTGAETGPTQAQVASADTAAGTEAAAAGRDSPQLASSTATVQRLSLPSGIQVPPVTEVAFVTPPPPPPFGTEFNFNEQGLVEATPEGALTPSGVTVFAGRPDVAPAPRPGAIVPPEPTAEPATVPAAEAAAEPAAAPVTAPVAAPEPSTEPVAAAIESAIAEAVGEALPVAPAAEPAAAPVIADDTPRADPALAGARPLPRPQRVREIGEQLEAERQAEGDQTSLAPQAETDTAALSTAGEDAVLASAASTAPASATVDATATRAGDGAAVTELAALEAPTPGGLALATLRPQRRPSDLGPDPVAEPIAEAQAETEAEAGPELDLSGATPEAVAQSPVPGERPDDIAERARAILAAASAANASASANADVEVDDGVDEPPARAADPVIPSAASVARAATEENAIRLNRVNLIGVFGSPNDRRALVRMSNGRVVRVQVGDRLDGGQVAAIGEAELHYVKNGRNEVLRIGG